MSRNWTPSQLDAIESRGSDLLVSAGAGSGKTAVLTERIIRRLVNDPDADVRRMLIVTFTKAAAGELRERISSALSDAIAADPALQKRFEVAGARCLSSTPEEALAYAAKERALWKDVVALSGAKAAGDPAAKAFVDRYLRQGAEAGVELKALSTGTDPAGGYAVPDEIDGVISDSDRFETPTD